MYVQRFPLFLNNIHAIFLTLNKNEQNPSFPWFKCSRGNPVSRNIGHSLFWPSIVVYTKMDTGTYLGQKMFEL